MANKQHAQFSDENGNIFYLENETEDVLDPSGKPLSNGGDLSEASVTFTPDATRKLPQSGGRFKAFLGSIVKYLTDLGAAAYLAVANNDTTTQPGFVGDARVLKQHRDAINQLNSEMTSQNDKIWKLDRRCQRYADYSGASLTTAITQILDDAVLPELNEGFFSWLVKTNQGYFALYGYLSVNATGIATQIGGDNCYTFYRNEGADAVLKKLGEAQFAEFSVSVNDIHPSMTWTAPGKIIRAGLTGAGSTTDPGGNSGPSVSCTFEGNVVTVSLWKFGGSCNAQGFVVYE